MKTAKKAEKATKKPATNKIDIPFGQWVREVARARGEIGAVVTALKYEKGLTVKTTLKTAEAKFGVLAGFDKVAARYNSYLRRGPLSKKAA